MHSVFSLRPLVVLVQLALLVAMAVPGRAVSLEECVALALRNNPDVKRQRFDVHLADRDLAEQRSADFGSLSLIASYNHYNLPRTLAPLTPATIADDPAGVATTKDLFLTGIAYELPLFTGFAQTRGVEISALQKEMARARLLLSREQLVYNVRQIYVQILSLRARKEAQAEYLLALQRLREDIDREYRQGKKARIDQLKAGADVKKAAAELNRIAAGITVLRDGLASLLVVDELDMLEEIPLPGDNPAPVTKPMDEHLDNLQRLRTARLEVEKNSKLVGKAESIYYPQLVFNTSYGQNFGPNDDTNRYSGDWNNQEVWQAGLNLRWRIFDFGGNKAKVSKARIREHQSRCELTKTELELKKAVREAVTSINTAVSDYASAREEYAMTRETEAIEQVRYDQGTADINDLLSAKARNQLAHSRLIGAGYGYIAARFHLDYLLEQGAPEPDDGEITEMR